MQWFGRGPVEPNHFKRDDRTSPSLFQKRFPTGHNATPALFRESVFSLRVHYQKTMDSRMPRQKLACQRPQRSQVTCKLALSNFANWILCFLPRSHSNLVMFIKSIWIGFVGLMLFVASAWAASSELQGIVKDAKGHPIQGADIRIETENTGRLLTTVKTDANGRYTLEGLAAGNYRVTLVVNGAVKTSINNTTLKPGESTQLNFDLKQTRASVTVKKGKHWVWIPAFTGSRLPGRWAEVDDSGSWAAEATANNIVRISGEELQRTIHSRDIKRGQ